MNSLREEINKELAKTMVWTIKNKQIDVHLPDRIVSIFEKRIDEWIKESDYDEEVEGCGEKIKEMLK